MVRTSPASDATRSEGGADKTKSNKNCERSRWTSFELAFRLCAVAHADANKGKPNYDSIPVSIFNFHSILPLLRYVTLRFFFALFVFAFVSWYSRIFLRVLFIHFGCRLPLPMTWMPFVFRLELFQWLLSRSVPMIVWIDAKRSERREKNDFKDECKPMHKPLNKRSKTLDFVSHEICPLDARPFRQNERTKRE